MEKPATHPSREELSAYSLGQLPEERAIAIDSHISECEPCCETIVELSSEDTFAGLLQEAGRLPADLTADHDSVTSKPSFNPDDIPPPLDEHPRYEVLGLIGKGGMGDVYKARHRKMERTVALKVINRGLVRKGEAIDRFHREVKAAAQLSHSNIVTAYDADQAGDFHFMVMEYVDGVDLSQTVKKRNALPVAEACEYIRQAAIGLQHAHERGMVHRDIKPHNLMVTADGVIKILDFGLASLTPEAIAEADHAEARGDLTAAGAIMGTPDFISPEQAEDAHQVDIRSDIYSLGATFYFLLSGRTPFVDGSVMHKLTSHAQIEPDSLKMLRSDIPDELVAITSKMMAKDPDQRYLTPCEVAEALETFLQTWQPGEVNSQGQSRSGGGNHFESGGQNSGAGDAGRDWLLAIARVLFAIALVPVALLCYETWAVDRANPDVGVGYRTWAYMLVTLCLSTIAGIASAVHRLNTGRSQSNRGDRRVFRMTAIEALTVAAVLIAGCLAAGLYYTNGNIGGIRVDVTAPEDIGRLGTHPLTIVDTSGKKPLGGTTSTHQDDASGITTHSFKSANGRYNITLVDDVLTVNGERYTLENPTDAIRIMDERVEITQVTVLSSKPELKITGKTVNKGTSGLPSVYDWNFKGRDVGQLKVRLLLAQDGKTDVIQEFDMEQLPAEFANKVRLEVKDAGTGSDRKRKVNAILYVERPVPSRSATVNEDKGLSLDVEAPFSNKVDLSNLKPIEPGQTELLLALSFWKGDMTHDLSMESMTAATEDGNVTFLFVTLDWAPTNPDVPATANELGTSPNGKPVSECAAIQTALREYYMDKYPLFAASVNQNSNILSDPSKLREREWLRQIDELGRKSPVSETFNSFPGKPYVTFTEVTEASQGEVLVVRVNLYRNADETCRAEVTKKQRKKRAGEPVAVGNPITEEEVHKLVQRVAKDSDFKQLQGNWESVSVTEGEKQLSTEDGFGGLLLQIKGDTFVIAERKPDGEKTEVDTGRIEINSTATPKTIDFIGRDERRLGIYKLMHGVLRTCLVEHGGTDGFRGERISDGNPVKRPTTFESPTGSNMMLMEFQRKSDNDLQTTEDAWSLPLVQVLHDAEGLTAKRVKIIGTFLVTDDKFGVRTYQISTAKEDLPPPPDEDAYRDREVTFEAAFDEEKIINVGQFHNKRVLATGPIYFFPSDSDSPAEVMFMMDGIYEYPLQTSKTKQPQ
jgi:uncharacterized protein (TIGR03067 family)